MNKSDLFSIGEFSQLTGVSIKALHYYEKINILSPAYIDASNNYRYYALYQVRQVEIIELLLDLDIQLNQLPKFVTGEFQEISYDKIFKYGKELTKQRICELENKMRYIDFLETQTTTNRPQNHHPIWLLSCNQASSIEEALKQILVESRSYELSLSDSYGRILFCNGTKNRLYYYAAVKPTRQQRILHENVFYLPDGAFRSYVCDSPCLEKSHQFFKDLFELPYDKIVLETEETCNKGIPRYTLHCLLPSDT